MDNRSIRSSEGVHELSKIKFENINKVESPLRGNDQTTEASVRNHQPQEFTEVFSFGNDRFG